MKKSKKIKKEITRIHDWFAGESEGVPVEFKFTYSWNLNKQVIVRSDTYSKSMSLSEFKNVVHPHKIDCKFISVMQVIRMFSYIITALVTIIIIVVIAVIYACRVLDDFFKGL